MAHAVSKPQLARAIGAFMAAGVPVRGLLCKPDGSITVLTEGPAAPVVEVEDTDDWIELAGDAANRTQGR